MEISLFGYKFNVLQLFLVGVVLVLFIASFLASKLFKPTLHLTPKEIKNLIERGTVKPKDK